MVRTNRSLWRTALGWMENDVSTYRVGEIVLVPAEVEEVMDDCGFYKLSPYLADGFMCVGENEIEGWSALNPPVSPE